jgi:hypothetical protein
VIIIAIVGLMASFPTTFQPPTPSPPPSPSGTSPTGEVCVQSPLYCSIYNRNNWAVLRSAKLMVSDVSRCLEGLEPTCYGQNPTTPYTILNFYTSKYPSMDGLPLTAQIQLGVFNLDPSQILVLYGPSPPACVYWGITLYLLSDPDKCNGKTLFATIADTMNNFNTGLPPNKPFALVMGCNQGVLDQFRDDNYNLYKLAFPYQGPNAKLYILGRTALFDFPGGEAIYYNNTRTSADLLQYRQLIDPALTITEPTWKPRATYYDEHIHEREFDQASDRFLQVMLEAYPEYTYVFTVPTEPFPYDNGYECIESCSNCNGDNRDTVYTLAYIPYEIQSEQQLVVVFGFNHSTTGKAVYTNLSVYNNVNDTGLESVNFLAGKPYYQVIVSPSPPEPIPSVGPYTVNELVLPTGVDKITLAERAYVQTIGPVTGIGAAPETILPPKVWVLSKVKNPVEFIPDK